MLSVVIPAYNESENIRYTIEEIRDITLKEDLTDNFEILVIDDHSYDSTYDVVESFKDSRIRCIRLSRRSGSHIALRAGLENVKGDQVLCISADGQDDLNVLVDMMKKWEEGAHIVWALRKRRKEPFLIKFSSWIFYTLLKLLARLDTANIDLSRADFYLLDRKILEAINRCPEQNTSLFGLISWLGFKQEFVEFNRKKRRRGETKWSYRSRIHLAKDWIVAFSGLPLKLMTVVGIFVALIGFVYATVVFIQFLTGNPAPGWSSLMIVLLILGGLQMVMFGIVGEYLWRNLDESRKRPLYFIEKSTDKEINKREKELP